MKAFNMFFGIFVASLICCGQINAAWFLSAEAEEDQKIIALTKIGQTPVAQVKINEIIVANPGDAKNLFRGAMLFFETGNIEAAFKNFDFAIEIGGPKYRKMVIDFYQKKLYELLQSNGGVVGYDGMDKARTILCKVNEMEPTLHKINLERLLELGNDFLIAGEEQLAYTHFALADLEYYEARDSILAHYSSAGGKYPLEDEPRRKK